MFLDAPRAVAAFPIRALSLEEELAGQVAPDQPQALLENAVRQPKTLRLVFAEPRPGSPQFPRLDDRRQFPARKRRRREAAIGAPFNRLQTRAVLLRHDHAPIACARF